MPPWMGTFKDPAPSRQPGTGSTGSAGCVRVWAMRLQMAAPGGHPDFLDLPWGVPLEGWESDRLVEVPRGIARHVVRFVNYDGNDLTGIRYGVAPNTTYVTSQQLKVLTCPSDPKNAPVPLRTVSAGSTVPGWNFGVNFAEGIPDSFYNQAFTSYAAFETVNGTLAAAIARWDTDWVKSKSATSGGVLVHLLRANGEFRRRKQGSFPCPCPLCSRAVCRYP